MTFPLELKKIALRMVFFEGKNYSEVAREIGASVPAVRLWTLSPLGRLYKEVNAPMYE